MLDGSATSGSGALVPPESRKSRAQCMFVKGLVLRDIIEDNLQNSNLAEQRKGKHT